MELIKKLRIDTDKPLWLINVPADVEDLFAGLDIQKKANRQMAQLLLFVTDSAMLVKELERLAKFIGHDTLFWICYPKKSGAITSDLVLMKSWDILGPMGFRGQTSAAIDDNWSGLRVTNAPRTKPSDCDLPMAERTAEGIDYVNRTVQLPDDAQKAINNYKGMADYFYSLSFTCKKEYVMAITDAKKEETRKRRIDKTIEQLQQKMMAKPKRV